MTKIKYQIVLSRVRTKAWAEVKTVALIDGLTVVSNHADFNAANVALCDALDEFYAHDRDDDHKFDIVALSYIPEIGAALDQTKILTIP